MRGSHTCSALLHVYCQKQSYEKAAALMEKMLECDFMTSPLPFNHMISMYMANQQLEKVPQVIEELKKKTTPDLVTYNLWLTMCKEQGDVENAERIFLELKKAKISPDWFTYSILSNLYMKVSATEKVFMTLKEMEKRATKKSRAAFSSLISLLTIMKSREEVFRIWKKMKSLFRKMSDAEYTCMIASLVKLGDIEEAEKLYAEWGTVSNSGDPSIRNVLLAAYINSNQVDKAESFYNQVMSTGTVAPCYTTFELMTWGYIKSKQMDKALCFLEKAIASVKDWKFDKKMIWELFEKLEEEGNVEGAEKLLVILRGAGHVSTRVYNSLLRTYAKAGLMPLIVAERMKKDDVCFDEETSELIEKTKNMLAPEISSKFS
ncbi:hypothetical protein MLD38_026425 [Melastoma candidum]|nr:hypothetical protein MLD38_026425 [Melastoma candidum]